MNSLSFRTFNCFNILTLILVVGSFLKEPKFSRHVKLNHTNVALLLQETTQKYRKLTDYWTKCCYLSLLFSLLNYDLHFLWTQYSTNFKRHNGSFVPYIVSFSGLKMAFSKLSLAKYHCLHKKSCWQQLQFTLFHVFNYHRMYLQIFFFYKLFCTNLSQVVLRRSNTERFL